MIDHVARNNFPLEREQLRVGRIDRHEHPMSVRIAKCFDAGEVLEHPVGLFAIEGFVNAMKMCIAMQIGDRFVVSLDLFRER